MNDYTPEARLGFASYASKMVENGGLMVTYHGTIRQKPPKKQIQALASWEYY